MGHIPTGMELFQASDANQWNYIKNRILDCDYYIVIVGEKYGSIGLDGKSYTQMEYEFAVENGIPVAAFLLDEDMRSEVPLKKSQPEAREQIDNFRALCKNRMVKYLKDLAGLGPSVMLALSELFRVQPRIGWVRGNSAASQEVLDELTKLSSEKRALQSEIHHLRLNQASTLNDTDVFIINAMKEIKLCKVDDNYAIFAPSEESLLGLFMKVARHVTESATHFELRSIVGVVYEKDMSIIRDLDLSPIIGELMLYKLFETERYQIDSLYGKPQNAQGFRITTYGKELWIAVMKSSKDRATGG